MLRHFRTGPTLSEQRAEKGRQNPQGIILDNKYNSLLQIPISTRSRKSFVQTKDCCKGFNNALLDRVNINKIPQTLFSFQPSKPLPEGALSVHKL